jgi:peptidoglycan hydrolase-like protein with peptidoglycan-binding domain
MDKIIRPIRAQDHGALVANLQGALLFIVRKRGLTPAGLSLDRWQQELSTELATQSFGTGTSRLLLGLLTSLNLPRAEFVDEPTAQALNRILDGLGAFSPDVPSESDSVFPLSLGIRGSRVAQLHNNLRKLGYEIPQSELDSNLFDVGTQSAVRQVQSKYGLSLTGVLDDRTQAALARAVAAADTDRPRAEGRIFFDHGQAAGNIILRFYNRGFGGAETRLGEIKTDGQGFYNLPYDSDGKPVNLEVRAVDGQNKEIPLSEVRFNADRREVLHLVAPANIQPLPAEYRRLTEDLTSHIGDLGKLKDARENDEQKDLTYLHQGTGWDARLIALAAAAQKLVEKTGLSHQTLYGIARAGLPTDEDLLARVDSSTVEKALSKARESGIIALSDQEIASAKASFEQFARRTRRTHKAPGALSSFGELLDHSGLSESEKVTFGDLHFTHGDRRSELWAKAREAGISEQKIDGLRLQGKLAFLTHNNAAFTAVLQQEIGSTGNLVQLVNKDLFRADGWDKRIKSMSGTTDEAIDKAIPPIYEGKTTKDRLNAYTEDLARKVRLSFPTHVVARRIETGELRLGADNIQASVPLFLKNAVGLGFELGRVPVETFVRQNRSRLFAGNASEAEIQTTKEAVKKLQRLYQITPSDGALKVMLDEGFTSAHDVVAFTEERFAKYFGNKFPSEKETRLTFRKAQQTVTTVWNFFQMYQAVQNPTQLPAVSSPPAEHVEIKNELIEHFPTMETLFGSMDFCECEHCHSVLSPAAYFVDLLKFLDPDDKAWKQTMDTWRTDHYTAPYPFRSQSEWQEFQANWQNKNPNTPVPNTQLKPYEVLIERRPDLPHLPLTCENTDTVLPYIDVVNEILEYYVANNKLSEEAVHDTGDATTAELLAEPQNIVPAAYEKLKEARYPIGLPFDLWLETVRFFFDYSEAPLWQVLETFRSSDALFAQSQPYDRAAIFREYIGLSPSESEILTDPNPLTNWFKLYGFDSDDDARKVKSDEDGQRIDLNSAKALSRRLGATYKQLVELVQTAFVNPRLDELVFIQKLGVGLTDVLRYMKVPSHEPLSADEQKAFEQRLKDVAATMELPVDDLKARIKKAWDATDTNEILVLRDPDSGCDFDKTTLEFATGKAADALVFLKLNLFVRLWKKLGWTIEETDRALRVFVPKNSHPLTAVNLGAAFKTALIFLAHLKAVSERIKVGKNARLKLLTLWSNLSTTGRNPLYAQLFLTRSVLKNNAVFDDPLGNYLLITRIETLAKSAKYESSLKNVLPADQLRQNTFPPGSGVEVSYDPFLQVQKLSYQGILTDNQKNQLEVANASKVLATLLDGVQQQAKDFMLVKGHLLAIQGALTLTADEVGRILASEGKNLDTAALSLDNISILYRYGLLANALKFATQDLATLIELSGLDPFKPLEPDPLTTQPGKALDLDYPFRQTLQFIDVAETVKESGFKVDDLDYLFRHRFDPVGKYRADPVVFLALVKSLAGDVRRIRTENAVPSGADAVTDDWLRKEFSVVMPPDEVEKFLGLLTGTAEQEALKENVPPNEKLDPKAFATEPAIRVAYDEVRNQTQRLTLRGMLPDWEKEQLKSSNPSALLATLLDEAQNKAFASVADRLESMIDLLASPLEFTSVQQNVQPAASLDPKTFAGETSIRVSYDDKKQTQLLAYRGVLLDEKKEKIKASNPSLVLAGLLDAVQSQSKAVASGIIESTIGVLLGMIEFQAVQTNVQSSNQLDRAKLNQEPAIRATYDEADQTQRLTFRGMLRDARNAVIVQKYPSPVLTALLASVQDQLKAFINRLRIGFLAKSDFKSLLDRFVDLQQPMNSERTDLAQALLPFVEQKLIRQAVLQTLASNLNSDPQLTDALLVNASLLSDPNNVAEPLLGALAASAVSGVTASFYASPDASGLALATINLPESDSSLRDKTNKPFKPAGTNSARFEGCFEVPASGAYRFFVILAKNGAEAELRVGEAPDAVINYRAIRDNDETSQFVELKPGLPYRFALDVRKLAGGDVALLVQGENFPKGSISRLTLYPWAAVERTRRAYVLLAKTLQIVQGFKFNEREVRYLFTHGADFDKLDLSRLPTDEISDSDATAQAEADNKARALFSQFLRLAGYARLKEDLAPDAEDLIGIFESARQTYSASTNVNEARSTVFDDVCQRVADLTRRELATVQEAAGILGFLNSTTATPGGFGLLVEAPDFAQEKSVQRLWDLLQVVENLGVPVEAVARWATPAPDFAITRDLRNTIKARYEPEDWQRIAKPIFDKLRQRQRDALVACIMHQHGFERMEQLFEYFLVDPGMEPVVQTSRLRLAISSVQTFIQRCFLNLEPKVLPHSSIINSGYWQWMKRYRVWEANRKIFLFPENWLEPEFRDDKTYLFQELEGALLQGDVSRDLVEDAFFTYLQKLEVIARLDIVTMYCEQDRDPSPGTLHVIGRTHGTPHKYFYRRYAHHMWTPWEPVTIEIEGDHVVAVVWKERLHLFWVTFLEKAEKDSSTKIDDSATVGTIAKTAFSTEPLKSVEIQLNCSDYFQGQWTVRESSGFGLSPSMSISVEQNFTPHDVFISASYESKDDPGVKINLSGAVQKGFLIVSKNSYPMDSKPDDPIFPPYKGFSEMTGQTTQYFPETGLPAYELLVQTIERTVKPDGLPGAGAAYNYSILGQSEYYSLLFPSTSPPVENWNYISPFFYMDSSYTFLVEPTLSEPVITHYEFFGITASTAAAFSSKIDDNQWKNFLLMPAMPAKPDTFANSLDLIDSFARFAIEPQWDWATEKQTVVHLNGSFIGKTGGSAVASGGTRVIGASGLNFAVLQTPNVFFHPKQKQGRLVIP